MDKKKLISIVLPTFNEEENVKEIFDIFLNKISGYNNYDFEIIFIDNSSEDRTVEKIKEIIKLHKNTKCIVNTRNFGHIRSPHYALTRAEGDAVILIASDFQDPPDLIPEFIKKWEEGAKIVMGVRDKADEGIIIGLCRKLFYYLVTELSEVNLVKNFTGFGLYDKIIINYIKKLDDPYPYTRGIIAEIGYKPVQVNYSRPARKKGFSKNNFYTLYDIAMLGIIFYSKIPLRIATISGFLLSIINFIIGIVYLIYKLLFWDRFAAGIIPLLITFLFATSVLLFFLGLIGEYLIFIHMRIANRPLVFEKERINFKDEHEHKSINNLTL